MPQSCLIMKSFVNRHVNISNIFQVCPTVPQCAPASFIILSHFKLNGSIFPYNNFTERQTSMLQIAGMCLGYTGFTRRLRFVPWFYFRSIFAQHSPECATYRPHHSPALPTLHTLHTPQYSGREQSLPHFWRSGGSGYRWYIKMKKLAIC